MKFFNYLNEKQIIIGGGKKYGQVVFLAGGAGSGKGHVIKQYMEYNKFKIVDVDEYKRMLIEINKRKGLFPEISSINMKNPKDVGKIHDFIGSLGVKHKSLELLMQNRDIEILPNILFDITLKDVHDIDSVMTGLKSVGYDKKNIHVVWVLSNYGVSVERNSKRDRIVPDDIMLKTHTGAPISMIKLLNTINTGSFVDIDGSISVVLNNVATYYQDIDGNPILNSKGEKTIKDFMYMVIKKQGSPIISDIEVKEKLHKWIINNIPKTNKTTGIFSVDSKDLF